MADPIVIGPAPDDTRKARVFEQQVPQPGGAPGTAAAATPQVIGPAATATQENPGGSERKLFDNTPDDSFLSGTAKNLGATGLRNISAVSGGMGGDLVNMAYGVGASILSKMPDFIESRSRQQIEREWRDTAAKAVKGRTEALERELAKPDLPDWHRKAVEKQLAYAKTDKTGLPRTTEEVYKDQFADRFGDYEPQSGVGKFGRAVGSQILPSALTAGSLGLTKGIAAGALSTAGSEAASHFTDDPLYLMGAGYGTPLAAHGAITTGRHAVLGKTAAEQKSAAADIIHANTGDPAAAAQAARARAGMPDETLAEATLDRTQSRAQEALLTAGNPEMADQALKLRQERNNQIMDALNRQGPAADPKLVAEGFRSHLDTLTAAADAQALPTAAPMETLGGNLRDAVHGPGGRAEQVKAMVDRLYAAVDPDGKMAVWTGDAVGKVRSMFNQWANRPEMGRPGAKALELLERARNFPRIMSFTDLHDFDKKITRAIKEIGSDDLAGQEALGDLKKHITEAQDQTVANQHKMDQAAVKEGSLDPNDTLFARLQREQADWYAKQTEQAAAELGAQPAGDGTVQQPRGPLTPFTPEAGSRLAGAKQGWGIYQDTFNKNLVGAAGETHFGGSPKMTNAAVAEKAFAPGSGGAEAARMWLAAGGPEGLAGLKEIALNRLQTSLSKGKQGARPLDEGSLNAWKAQHADALRVIDEADAAGGANRPFSSSFDDIAAARKQVSDFENSSAQRFLGLHDPDYIVTEVGKVMSGHDPAMAVRNLIGQAQALPNGTAIVSGIRRAAEQWVERSFTQHGMMLPGDTGPVPVVGGAGLKKFIATHGNMLKEMFDPAAVADMTKVADTIDRSVTVRTLANSLLGGSTTAPRHAGLARLQAQLNAAAGIDIKNGGMTVGAMFAANAWSDALRAVIKLDPTSALGHTALALGQSVMRRIMTGRGLQSEIEIAKLVGKGFASREVGLALLEQGIDEHGRPNTVAFDNLARALIAAEIEGQREARQPKPVQRAAGGRTGYKLDCVGRAARLCREADAIRKKHAGQTRVILHAPDDAVATALALAGRGV